MQALQNTQRSCSLSIWDIASESKKNSLNLLPGVKEAWAYLNIWKSLTRHHYNNCGDSVKLYLKSTMMLRFLVIVAMVIAKTLPNTTSYTIKQLKNSAWPPALQIFLFRRAFDPIAFLLWFADNFWYLPETKYTLWYLILDSGL